MNAPLLSAAARGKTDFLANAHRGWGEQPPDWIVRLAEECERTSASEVARRLG